MHELRGKRVLVMGLGSFGGGVGVARFCAGQGAQVTITDLRPAEQLRDSIEKLNGMPIRLKLGGHDPHDFITAELIIVNPAVDRRNNPYLQAAEQSGVALTSEIELLIERIDRQRVIGVTGTAGKSTTVAMIGHILAEVLGPGRVHVGGNIGGSLLGELGSIGPADWIVLELSSFMLQTLSGWSPHIAVVTNISDNHLDRHGTFESYAAAKKQILRSQTSADHAVLGPSVAHWQSETPAAVRMPTAEPGVRPAVPGEHNRFNAAMAVAACTLTGIEGEAAIHAIHRFNGLPHRLQIVLEHRGVWYYNDSKSTTPESAILAIDSFEPGQVHVILGGYDKKSDLTGLAAHAARRCAAIYAIGQTGDTIADAARKQPGSCPVHRSGTIDAAVAAAVRAAHAGQVVLLSPGCASWDQFTHYEQRGTLFAELALRYTSDPATGGGGRLWEG